MRPEPPRIARWLLGKSVTSTRRWFVLDELDEAFAQRGRTNPRMARRWYRRQAILSALLFVAERTRRRAPVAFATRRLTIWLHYLLRDLRYALRTLTRRRRCGDWIDAILPMRTFRSIRVGRGCSVRPADSSPGDRRCDRRFRRCDVDSGAESQPREPYGCQAC